MTVPDFWRSSLDPMRVMNVQVTHWREDEQQQRSERLTVEYTLEVRTSRRSRAVIMRSPGHDHEVAMGFLFTEGIMREAGDIATIEDAVDTDGLPLANVVNVRLRHREQPDTRVDAGDNKDYQAFERRFAVSASCGLCSKESIADLMLSIPPLEASDLRISASCIYELSKQLRTAQDVFSHTAGLHAAVLFTSTAELCLRREDVGRHNAVDNLIGYGLLHNTFPYSTSTLLVSGRTSFEIIQKPLLAPIPSIPPISPPPT